MACLSVIRNPQPKKEEQTPLETLVFSADECQFLLRMMQKVYFAMLNYNDEKVAKTIPHSSGKKIRYQYWQEVYGRTLLFEFKQPVLLPGMRNPAKVFRVGPGSLTRSVLVTGSGGVE